MKTVALGLFLSTLLVQSSYAQQPPEPPTETIKTAASHTPEEQEIINLSKSKWDWMADKKADALDALFDDKAMFTHMGGNVGQGARNGYHQKWWHLVRKLRFTRSTFAYSVPLSCSMTLIWWQWSAVTK